MSFRDMERLRWRCRRGMLENDLVLARFLDQSAASLDADAAACLYRLLDLSDNDLWGLISGREEPPDAALAPMVRALRAA